MIKQLQNITMPPLEAVYPEMEFLDISLTKDSRSFAPCYSQSRLLADFKENRTLLWF
jgi:hypothetical protein